MHLNKVNHLFSKKLTDYAPTSIFYFRWPIKELFLRIKSCKSTNIRIEKKNLIEHRVTTYDLYLKMSKPLKKNNWYRI